MALEEDNLLVMGDIRLALQVRRELVVHMELGVGLERNLDEGHKQEQVEQLLEVEEE